MQQFIQYLNSPKLGILEDEDQDNKMTLRLTLEKFMLSKFGRMIVLISTFLSIMSFLIHVASTYDSESFLWFENLNIGILCFYIIEYSLNLFIAQHRWQYIMNTQSIVEIITFLPIIVINNQELRDDLVSFIQISVIFRLIRIAFFLNQYIKTYDGEMSNVMKQIIYIFIWVLSILLIFASILLVFEKPARIQKQINSNGLKGCYKDFPQDATFHEQVYFVIVTIGLIGFGDVNPSSYLSRIFVIFLILIVIIVIPKQTNELIRLMDLQSPYARAFYKYNSDIPHIIICGQVDVNAFITFCNELYHPDHGQTDKNVIILQSEIPSTDLEIFLNNPLLSHYLIYLQGNPMEDRDLKRAATTKAKSCVILTNKQVQDAISADHKNILTGLAIKKYVHHVTNGENIRLCIQLIKPQSKIHYYSSLSQSSSEDQLVVMEEFKMNLLAKSCFCPGIISMLGNLISSTGDQDTDLLDQEWIKEYIQGMGHEIYRTDLSSKFEGKSFCEMASIIYNDFNGIIFAIEVEINDHTIIRLNPGQYTIPNIQQYKVHVYMICEDKEVADLVSTYEMNPDELIQYQQQQMFKNKKDKGHKGLDKDFEQPDEKIKDDESNIDDLGGQDEELLMDYVIENQGVHLQQVSSNISLKDSPEVKDHIVVCGIHPSLFYFILPLRARYLKKYQYIVLLSPQLPQELWETINMFPKIIYMKGSPLLIEDLVRANINQANKAVILGVDEETNDYHNINEMCDAETIFIYKAIKKCNSEIQIMVELVYLQNIEFLFLDEYNQSGEQKHEYNPLFAAGEIYNSNIIDTVTCQSYYNTHIITILQQILTGGKSSNPTVKGICDNQQMKQSNIWQIPIPEDYLNKSFGALFNYLCLERNLIPLGLYRLPGISDNTHPYVYTNPPDTLKLNKFDKIFILSYIMPNDLLEGTNIKKKINTDIIEIKGKQEENLLELEDDHQTVYEYSNQEKKVKVKEELQTNNDPDDRIIQNSTVIVLDQLFSQIQEMKLDIENTNKLIAKNDDIILEKVLSAFRTEISSINQ